MLKIDESDKKFYMYGILSFIFLLPLAAIVITLILEILQLDTNIEFFYLGIGSFFLIGTFYFLAKYLEEGLKIEKIFIRVDEREFKRLLKLMKYMERLELIIGREEKIHIFN